MDDLHHYNIGNVRIRQHCTKQLLHGRFASLQSIWCPLLRSTTMYYLCCLLLSFDLQIYLLNIVLSTWMFVLQMDSFAVCFLDGTAKFCQLLRYGYANQSWACSWETNRRRSWTKNMYLLITTVSGVARGRGSWENVPRPPPPPRQDLFVYICNDKKGTSENCTPLPIRKVCVWRRRA